MSEFEPQPRRGRPPNNSQQSETGDQPRSRRRRASVGTASLKLDAPTRAGFVRRWVNDQDNRIAQADELGYDHVTDQSIKTDGSDTRVSRLVGTKANGDPLRAFLMETPEHLHRQGVDEKEDHNRLVDAAIAAGADSTGQMPQSETYGRGSIQRDR